MQVLYLRPGVQSTLPVPAGARAIRLVNDPTGQYALLSTTWFQLGIPAAIVLVGFNRPPSDQSFDGAVPPGAGVTIALPPNLAVLNLLWPSNVAANPGILPGAAVAQYPIVYDFLACEEPESVDLVDHTIVPTFGSALATFFDQQGNFWPPSRYTGILDQGIGVPTPPVLRPAIAPSQIVAVHAVLVAATLTPIASVVASASQYQTLKRLLISVSAAGLLVVGAHGLSIGSPGAAEVVRVAPAAAGVLPPIDFGEGLSLGWFGVFGAWSMYSSVANTVDLTFILG